MKSAEEVPIHLALGDLTVIDYLAILRPDLPRRAIESLFAAGRVRSAGMPAAARWPVGELKELSVAGGLEDLPRIHLGRETAAAGESIRILHQDERFTVLSKPSGVPVIPDRKKSLESILGFLIRRELEDRKNKPPGEFRRCRIVHRIDRFTSGLVITASTAETERRLAADFQERRIQKEYLALLAGEVEAARLTVDCPVGPGRKGKMRAEAAGAQGPGAARAALTEFEVLERFRGLTLVRALPRTGRTHQIRVHAWAMGHPLALDPLYNTGRRPDGTPLPAREVPGIRRLTLHAHRYTLPADWDAPRSFACPLPADFLAALEALRGELDTPGSEPPHSAGISSMQ